MAFAPSRLRAAAGGPGSIQVARVLGIPIYVHFSWIVVFGLIAWTLATNYFPDRYPELAATSHWARGLAASLLFFASVLLHELGHSVVAIRYTKMSSTQPASSSRTSA